MQAFLDGLSTFWQQVVGVLLSFNWSDILDIILVAFLLYNAIKLVRETRAAIFIKAIVIVVIFHLVALVLRLDTINWLMDEVIFQYGIFTLLIVFQPELRRVLERLGRSSFSAIRNNLSSDEALKQTTESIDAVCVACRNMSNSKTGALIVFERQVLLGDVIATGTVLDAAASNEMVQNVFYPKAPLHDGAMIVRDGKVYAAACILPLTQKEVNRELGTRHRAAIGISENSDALVVVVSEETGAISVALNGFLRRDFNYQSLKAELERVLLNRTDDSDNNGKRPFWKGWKMS